MYKQITKMILSRSNVRSCACLSIV